MRFKFDLCISNTYWFFYFQKYVFSKFTFKKILSKHIILKEFDLRYLSTFLN